MYRPLPAATTCPTFTPLIVLDDLAMNPLLELLLLTSTSRLAMGTSPDNADGNTGSSVNDMHSGDAGSPVTSGR